MDLRQGDIRKLCWSSYDGALLNLRIGKNQSAGRQGPMVSIPCTKSLRAMLDEMSRSSAVILTTKEGRPFTARYFGHQWEDAMRAAKLTNAALHFHDLRGMAVTMLAEAGCSVPQIASITQHSLATATRILETYLAPDSASGDPGDRPIRERSSNIICKPAANQGRKRPHQGQAERLKYE